MTQERSIIAEIEGTFANGSAGKQAEILRRVTDLFLAGADKYSDEHVDLFDGVISRIAEKIETKARAELAHRLAPAENAPPNTVRMLARDESIEVAGPILSLSNRLSDDDLLAIASDNSQDRLLAISKRPTVSEKISDVLVTHGNRDVVLSVTQNEGARFSDAAYGKLVDRSINDEVLAICVSMRKDIPREHFNALIAKASEVVFEKLAASNPDAVYEVHKVLADITGQDASAQPRQKRDYREAAAQFDMVRRSGAPVDPVVCEYAAKGQFEETVAALSALCQAPSKANRKRHERLAGRKRFRPYPRKGCRPVVAHGKANLHLAPQGISLFPPVHRSRTSQFRSTADGNRKASRPFLQRAPFRAG